MEKYIFNNNNSNNKRTTKKKQNNSIIQNRKCHYIKNNLFMVNLSSFSEQEE